MCYWLTKRENVLIGERMFSFWEPYQGLQVSRLHTKQAAREQSRPSDAPVQVNDSVTYRSRR